MKILLPVDGSSYTKRMLSYLAAHDELLGKDHDYTFVTVIAPVPQYAMRFLERGALEDYRVEEAEAVLKPVLAFAEQQHWSFRAIHEYGHAAQVIADVAAAHKPDLIVMGTHGHSALGNVILGSVASGVLARCAVPVLLIR